MASLLSARKKKQQRRRHPPGDEVDFYPIDEEADPTQYSSHPRFGRRHRHRPRDEHAQIHGLSPPRAEPESPLEDEPGHLEGEPRRLGHFRKKEDSRPPTPDMEMVEMRHPERLQRTHGGYRPRYVKSPSSDSESPGYPGSRPIRASAYSTLSVKSWSELNTEITTVMRDLNRHFRPIFDKHGPEGVSIKKLKEELNSRRSQHLMGRASIAERLQLADKDGDDYLSYADFVIMITQDLKHDRKLAFRGMLLSTLGSIGVLPIEKRDNFLANYTLCPPPLFIPIITLVQVIIFAVYVADMEDRGLEVTANSGYPFYSPLPYSPKRRWQAWRFLTYMFIHDGYLHILYNVITQLLFGFPLEMVHSWWRTAIIYLTGVTAGSLAHSVVDPGVGLVGASGGVYAILGAHLAAVVTNWKEMNYRLCDQEEFDSKPCCAISRMFFSAHFRLVLVVLIVVPDTGLAIVRRAALDEELRVGVSAHVGGFLTGLFLGIPVLKNINKHAWETHLGWITLVVFLLVCAFAIFFNSFFHERYPPTDWS